MIPWLIWRCPDCGEWIGGTNLTEPLRAPRCQNDECGGTPMRVVEVVRRALADELAAVAAQAAQGDASDVEVALQRYRTAHGEPRDAEIMDGPF